MVGGGGSHQFAVKSQHGWIAVVLGLCQRLEHHGLDRWIYRRHYGSHGFGLLVNHLVQDRRHGVTLKWYAAGEQLVGDCSQGEFVGALVDFSQPSHGLLRSHVLGRAHDGGLLGQLGGCLAHL